MWYYIVKDQPNELYHHGIKGMKWGIRRYQNEDGSLTNAGKRRYTSGDTRWVRKQVTSSISKSITNKIGKDVGSTKNSIAKKTVAIGASGYGITYAVNQAAYTKGRNNFVNRYLVEHPNTDKTIAELNKMYYKKKIR